MKALSGKSTRFLDVNEEEMVINSNTNLERIDSGKTKFEHQKNRQNGQEIGIVAEKVQKVILFDKYSTDH